NNSLTEQVNHDKQLNFQDLANNAPVMIWIINENAECTYINKQWCEYTGTTLEGNLNKGWLSGIHPDDVSVTRNAFIKASINQNDFTVDYRLKRFDGKYRWMAVSGMPRFSNNKFLGYIGTVIDIDDRKKIDEQLKESEEAFRTLAETIPNFVWTTDPDGNLDYYNSKFIDYVGMPVEEIKELGWKIFVHPDDLPRCLVLWEYSLKTGKTFEYESRYRKASDGQYRWFIARAVPLYDQEKNIIKWYVTCSDIHEQKRIEQFLEKQVKQVESEVYIEKNKLRSVFMNAPAVISVMNGPEHIYEFYNAKLDQILNRENIIGKTAREAQPELEGTGFFEILDEVYKTGKPFIDNEMIADTGDNNFHYFNFIYQPIFNDKNQVEGVTTFGFEVTEQVFAR
ncbi:PAS domain S-box protein, partial [bacterium]